MRFKGFIFDLDGVVVDTRPYHFLAWSRVARAMGVDLTHQHNEELRGLSRMASFEKILDWSGSYMTEAEKMYWTDIKNNLYVELIKQMRPDEVLAGVRDFLAEIKMQHGLTALVSSSTNAKSVLQSTEIEHLFDAVIDGEVNKKGKPAPDCFLLAADMLALSPACCVVFEDAPVGVLAARKGGFATVAIGQHAALCNCHAQLTHGFESFKLSLLDTFFEHSNLVVE
jgi:beta-phosphoglucomutase